ncbi:DUF4912 domain-containing protein [Anaeromyxobacter oryzae]|uniref:Rho termination factor N-terminal domain-containing protein n=1 Tax=Anaeromyxobacter oryzae TaxID=2918170 RepID=A0ABM7WRH7_9BACT|nr:DUF4912 domain-containing protein [Anaeromyxobacter oryzae]BDG02069.1 hypothetical protein AMOR_10650 [Anaeromyxobacter oryzae]
MPDFKKMTVQSLRELARKVIGPGHTRLKTKSELVSALEQAGASPAKEAPASRVRAAATRAAEATGKAVRAAKAAAGRAAEQAGKATAGRAAKVAAAGVAAAGAVAGARAAARTRAKKSTVAKAAAAVATAAVGAAAGAAAGLRRKSKAAAAAKSAGAARRGSERGPDPEGYFVARVRGENAVRDAPHPMREDAEDTAFEEGGEAPTRFDEGLGDLPWGYGDDAFVALPRDPRTIYFYWDHSSETVNGGFGGLEHARAQLWVFARSGAGWDRIRVLEFALESRGYYVHDLEPGRVYRAEIHAVDRQGRERLVGRPSNEIGLPPLGPSSVIDDRFIRIPWEVPLGRLLGPGHAGGPFSDEARSMLARLSDWSRFTSKAVWGGSAGAPGERPSSPTSAPSSPTSPAGPHGSGDR